MRADGPGRARRRARPVLRGSAGPARGGDLPAGRRVTDAVDTIVAFLVMILVNALIVRRIRTVLPGDEGAFLGRAYVATLVLRYLLALFLNANAGQSSFAVMFWG